MRRNEGGEKQTEQSKTVELEVELEEAEVIGAVEHDVEKNVGYTWGAKRLPRTYANRTY